MLERLTPEQDPAVQATQAAAGSTEYRLSLLAVLAPVVLALGAMGLLALGRLDFQELLILLGIILGSSVPGAWAARGYSNDRAVVKATVAKGAADVAVAQVAPEAAAAIRAENREAGARP
jgi:hypothetical protein